MDDNVIQFPGTTKTPDHLSLGDAYPRRGNIKTYVPPPVENLEGMTAEQKSIVKLANEVAHLYSALVETTLQIQYLYTIVKTLQGPESK